MNRISDHLIDQERIIHKTRTMRILHRRLHFHDAPSTSYLQLSKINKRKPMNIDIKGYGYLMYKAIESVKLNQGIYYLMRCAGTSSIFKTP